MFFGATPFASTTFAGVGIQNVTVLINGKRVNSQTLKLPSGKILKGENRKLFETKKIKLDVLKSEKILGLN